LITVKDRRRKECFRLRYTSLLNVFYWQEMVSRRRRKRALLRFGIGTAGAVVSAIIYFLDQKWSTCCSAVAALLTVAFTIWWEGQDVKSAELGHGTWSELNHDADKLWREGEDGGWTAKLDEKLGRLDERAKHNQMSEKEPDDDQLILKCETRVNTYLSVLSRKEKENVREVSTAETPATAAA
jgi:hypothetical protein